MKYFNLLYITFFVLSGVLFSGCSDDFFDKQPLTAVSDGTFWTTEQDAELGLVGCYHIEPSSGGNWECFWNNRGMFFLDLAAATGSDKGYYTYSMTGTALTSSNTYTGNFWRNTYTQISACNNFIDHINNVDMDEDKKEIMLAEVRAIRAYDFFNLAFYFGNVPMPLHFLSISEANTISQTPQAEVWAFVEDELTECANILPTTRPEEESGRITSGAALAMLGRLLMAEEKWAEAAKVYKRIIEYGVYEIDPKFEEIFWEEGENSKEIILSTQYIKDVFQTKWYIYLFPEMAGGWHQFSLYNELVKEFECIDGKTINESPLYEVHNPYENRDPRLDYTVMISDRTVFQGNTYISRPGSGSRDAFNRYNWSGYAIKKFCDENFTGNPRNVGANWIVFRYAEILLSYLESVLESGGTIEQSLLDQTINLVRGREAVQMPPVTTIDPGELREIVRRERRVELAIEGLRYYDILRWGIAAQELNGQFTGMKLTDDPENYSDFPVDDEGYYIYESKSFVEGQHELWPIPLSEIQINENLIQNPGY